jgi:hypothetical protein
MPEELSVGQKALAINLDPTTYGIFAEIGAGQEVARWFFSVGGAAGTVAKTISAYDMAESDAIYGPAGRYVSRQRLEAMLDYEYARLTERQGAKRGDATTFFVFADTVATASYRRPGSGRGWVGIRFQLRPHDAPSEAGRLFKRSVKMYVYPVRDEASGEIVTVERATLQPPWHHLRDLLVQIGRVVPIRDYKQEYLSIRTPEVLARIQSGDASWEAMVPAVVADTIKAKRLFGYSPR